MRLHITLAILAALLLYITLRANLGHRFAFSHIETLAQQHALGKYVPMPNVLPLQLSNLTPEQEAGIFWKDTYRLWRKKGLPFQVDFYHVSRSFPHAPQIFTVDRKGPHILAYSPSFFNFLNLNITPPLPNTLGYAGFYLRYPDMAPDSKPDSLDGFFSVLGGSYFRALAKEQVYGLSGRGLALNTYTPNKSEEFPDFTQWWLKEPAPNAHELVLDALLDSPSVTGAYEFKIRPGVQTTIDVHATLLFRQSVEQVGIDPFSSMYFYGENAKDHFGNFHPEIHDSDGLLINNSKDDWIWRPLQPSPVIPGYTYKDEIQNYTYPDENPRGYGLCQRDRDFQHYQDLDMKYNVRPSAWVTPHGNWGKGSIQLVQLPTNNTNTDNVVLFWQPASPVKAGDRLTFDYTIDFYMNDADRPPLAFCKSTLVNSPAPPPPPPEPMPLPPTHTPASGKGNSPSTPPPATKIPPLQTPPQPLPKDTVPVQYLVDFGGNGLENIPADHPPDYELLCEPPQTPISNARIEKNGYDNLWRVTFTVTPLKHFVPTQIHCRLTHGGKPLSETWTYTLYQ